MSLLALCAFAFLAGFIDSVVGGGGLIQLPALILFLPTAAAPVVLGTSKLASVAGTTAAAITYSRRVGANWGLTLVPTLVAIGFAYLGARTVSVLSRDAFRPLILVMLIAMAAYTFWRKDLGAIAHPDAPDARRARFYGIIIGAALGFYDGFFGPGTGSLLVFLFVGVMGLDFLRASAAAKIINAGTNVAALAYFLAGGHVLYRVAIPMAVANLAGSVLGARMAVKRGSGFVRILFLVVVSALIAKIAWDTAAPLLLGSVSRQATTRYSV